MTERTHPSETLSQTRPPRARSSVPRTRAASRSLGLIAVLLSALSCASLGDPQAVLDELGPRQTLPLAWRISGGPGANLYVLGSIHLGPARGWEYPPGIIGALEDSNALVVEVNVNEMPGETIQQLIGHYGHLPPGRSLRRSLSPATWALMENSLAKSSIPLSAANRLQPWLLSNLIIMEAIRRENYFADQGTEDEFIRLAGGRSIIPLESPAEQISFLGTLPRTIQELYLVDTLNHYDETGKFVNLYVNAWRSGDEGVLEKLVFDSYFQDPAFAPFFEAIIFDRNERMSKRLKVLLDANQHAGEAVFVVLGVAHMIGERSIRETLATQGYRIRRVTRSELRRVNRNGDPLAERP